MPRVKQFDQQEVLEKAMNLFWIKGYHATSIQDLVDHLNINRASLYDTYGGKKELFEKALDHYMSIHQRQNEILLKNGGTAKDTIRQLLELAVKETLSDKDRKGCFVVNTTTELAACDAAVNERVLVNQRQFVDLFQSLIIRGQAQGEISSEKTPRALALSMYVIFTGLRVVGKAYLSRKDLKSIVEPILTILD